MASATSLAVPEPPGSAISTLELKTLMWLRDKGSVPEAPLKGRCVRMASSTKGLGYPGRGIAGSSPQGTMPTTRPGAVGHRVEGPADGLHDAFAGARQQMHPLGCQPAADGLGLVGVLIVSRPQNSHDGQASASFLDPVHFALIRCEACIIAGSGGTL